jgi:hypothetical protein
MSLTVLNLFLFLTLPTADFRRGFMPPYLLPCDPNCEQLSRSYPPAFLVVVAKAGRFSNHKRLQNLINFCFIVEAENCLQLFEQNKYFIVVKWQQPWK